MISRRIASLLVTAAAILAAEYSAAGNEGAVGNIRGSLFSRNYEGEAATPLPGYSAYLFDGNGSAKVTPSPSITDVYGRYSFRNLPQGNYVLKLFAPAAADRVVWQEDVSLGGDLELKPVAIPTKFPADVKASFSPCANKKPRCYDFKIWTNVAEARKPEVEKVTYKFDHPTFKRKTYVVNAGGDGTFKAQYTGWGCLTSVSVRIAIAHAEPIFVDFDMCRALHGW